ncbi:hypothetical protein FA15DRAFT_688697 [Coprinopsis marcescibilis]|uniref:F-box domain-containing protein n=1 Tax=Coprinopsis marcescibilis TaxID=230819 RepID=A0A5C3KMP7_COPMA|nr:hypothetical protein FA15DRAFT_688697 [Coprinopsis marcescibilis]
MHPRPRQTDLLTTKLPPELIIDIFTRVLQPPARTHWTAYTPPHTPLTPFFFAKICAHWRVLTQGAPELWGSLTLTLHPRHYPTQVALLREWLVVRSGGRPLDVILRGRGEGAGDAEGDAEDAEAGWWEMHPPREVVRLLAGASRRWRSADLFIPALCYPDLACMHRAIDGGQGGALPLLQVLTLRAPDGLHAQTSHPAALFADAPNLVRLALKGLCPPPSGPQLPLSNLTHLSAQDLSVSECYRTLRAAPALQAVRLDCVHQAGEFVYAAGEAIVLEALRRLEVRNVGNGVARAVLGSLVVPRLEEVCVGLGFSFEDRERFGMGCVVDLVRRGVQYGGGEGRSACGARTGAGVRRMEVVNVRLVEEELVDCLEVMPGLEELVLHVEYPKTSQGMFISDVFLGALVGSGTPSGGYGVFDKPLVPKLRVLEYSGPVDVSGRALQTMLEVRTGAVRIPGCAPVAKLERVYIESTSGVNLSREVQVALKGLSAGAVGQGGGGLDLTLTNGYVSWIHDDWVTVRQNPKGAPSLEPLVFGGDRSRSNMHSHSSSGSITSGGGGVRTSGVGASSSLTVGLKKVLLSRRSQTPGVPPPRKPLTNPLARP